jgi:hypothetical protein
MIFIPSLVFPCECCGEGIVVTPLEDTEDISEGEVIVEEDKKLKDMKDSPFIQLSFWEHTSKNSDNRLNLWNRIKDVWCTLRGRSPWTDMVIFRAKTARHFAHHLLYIIDKMEKEKEDKNKVIFESEEEKR